LQRKVKRRLQQVVNMDS